MQSSEAQWGPVRAALWTAECVQLSSVSPGEWKERQKMKLIEESEKLIERTGTGKYVDYRQLHMSKPSDEVLLSMKLQTRYYYVSI